MNIQDAAVQILKDEGKPLHAKEIVKRIIEAGLWKTKSKTPEATVSAHLYSEIKKHGNQSTFVKVEPGTFFLRDTQIVAVSDAKEPRNVNPSGDPEETYSFLDAAEKVLDQFGNRKPMHYREITDKAMNQGWLNTSSKAPKTTMNAQLGNELKRAKASGKPARFVRTSPGYYGLGKWNVNPSGDPEETYSFLDAAEKVLDQFGNRKPMHYREITDKAMNQGWLNTSSKAPKTTMNAQLGNELKRAKASGKPGRFVRTSPGYYGLGKWNVNLPDDPDGTYSFLDAAEKVLDLFGNREPMDYREITDEAINQGWLNTSSKTPWVTMNAQLWAEFKRAKARGELGRFECTSRGFYSLVRWVGTGLPQQISKHNRKIRKKRLSLLMGLSPTQFEELVGQLLTEMGFERIEVTKSYGDGGIDVRGTLLISDVVRIKMAVQAKRWKANIQRPIVQQVRGSLGVHEQGLIITTSDFSRGAITEANEPNKTPVGLMNGEQLSALLMEYNIGVRRTSHNLFELEELPVAEKPK